MPEDSLTVIFGSLSLSCLQQSPSLDLLGLLQYQPAHHLQPLHTSVTPLHFQVTHCILYEVCHILGDFSTLASPLSPPVIFISVQPQPPIQWPHSRSCHYKELKTLRNLSFRGPTLESLLPVLPPHYSGYYVSNALKNKNLIRNYKPLLLSFFLLFTHLIFSFTSCPHIPQYSA